MVLLKMIKHLWEICSSKKKKRDLTYMEGKNSVVWLETQVISHTWLPELELQQLWFQRLPAHAAQHSSLLETFSSSPLFCPAVLFLALCRAVLCPVWGETGLDGRLSGDRELCSAPSAVVDNTCSSEWLCCLHNWEVSHSSSLFKTR